MTTPRGSGHPTRPAPNRGGFGRPGTRRSGVAAGCVLLALSYARPATAQILESVQPNGVPGFDTSPGTTVLTRGHLGFEPDVIRVGGYTISPNLSEQFGYESNLFGTIVPRGSPEIQTSPSLSVDRPYSDGDVNASASFTNVQYPSIPQEGFNTDSVSIGASHDFGNDTAHVGYTHLDSEIVPSEFNFLNVLVPIPVSTDTVRADYETQFSRFSVQPNIAWSSYGYGNTVQDGVFTNISYLDRSDVDAGVNIAYELAPARKALLVIEGDDTYFGKTDPTEPKLDNVNIAALVGYEDYTGGLFSYYLLAGYQNQTFQFRGYGTQSQPIAEGGLVYTPTGLLTFTLTGRHEIEQSTQPDQIGFTYDHIGFETDYEYRRNIILTSVVSYDRDTFTKSGASGDSWSASESANYHVNRYMTLNLSLGYTTYKISQATEEAFVPGINPLGILNPLIVNENGRVNVFTATVGVNLSL